MFIFEKNQKYYIMKKLILGLFLGLTFLFTSCGENKNTDVVESGTYQGVAEEG